MLKLFLGLLGLFLSHLAFATPEYPCDPPNLEMHNGICHCKAGGHYLDPNNTWEVEDCSLKTVVQETCHSDDPNALKMISGRCFCRYSNDYIEEQTRNPYRPEPLDIISVEIRADLLKKIETCKKLGKRPGAQSFATLEKARTIRITDSSKEGKHGGHILTVEKMAPGDTWNDQKDAPGQQFDIRASLQSLGPEVAQFLGFKMDDIEHSNHLEIPDLNELNFALKKIYESSYAPCRELQKLPRTIYEAKGQELSKTYVEKYLISGGIPFSQTVDGDQTYLFHDYFHLAGHLYLPDFVSYKLKWEIENLMEFQEHFSKTHPQLYQDPRVKHTFQLLYDNFTESVDNATAYLNLSIETGDSFGMILGNPLNNGGIFNVPDWLWIYNRRAISFFRANKDFIDLIQFKNEYSEFRDQRLNADRAKFGPFAEYGKPNRYELKTGLERWDLLVGYLGREKDKRKALYRNCVNLIQAEPPLSTSCPPSDPLSALKSFRDLVFEILNSTP